ncbi:MAG: diguanylate cyclase [Acidobacteriota bacterium]
MLNFWSAKPIGAYQAAETFFGTTQQLTEAIARSAIPADEFEYGQFRTDLNKMAERMSLENPSDTLVTVGSVGRALEEYNGRVGRAVRQYQVELRGMVGMLTETVTQCTVASDRSKDRLHSIEHRLDKAQAIEDIRLLKLQLAECLESLRVESEEQRKVWTDQIQTLSSGLATARKSLADNQGLSPTSDHEQPGEDVDPATGLHSRRGALEALEEQLRAPDNKFAVVFSVDRAETANLRYGYAVGDQMIQLWQQLLFSWFGNSARLFRWSGPTLVVLLERETPIERLRGEVAKMCVARQEKTFHVGNRSVLMLVSASHLVLRISDFTTTNAIAKRIDSFIKDRASE